GFHGTIGHSDVWNRIDAPNHYTFMVRDEGAAAQLGALHGFFAGLPFWQMQPFTRVTGDAVALADPGKIYVIYFPHGGAATVDFPATQGPLTARWFNPRAGEFNDPVRVVPANLHQKFTAPDTNDWALLVR
ncbi:MAG TPA: putative collagen-binding domain-containing protein, partial [Candidatus Acidoferrum sp.]|nr:putative collagen-binding domain-containing protein [Candidatus Acidoferrum sp.]